nr:putative transmembrane protein 217B [Oryctolagus cuniculus]XP_051710746.1 putative transmembrane protein 217B [Oryctolagus cuniculus]XP_051710747.1 putative transmembrane protein 217B [Oryctolagus cuniculus]XP_051710748.1 putative transmembrane protein 217B [Oryctolagus cuniculus]XP_051710749.1 putative transmembrane protein 217B [Oryctolagus cuniculus]XP_051710750.1 putative transmembrane protein 217B [Oryctolagus cuniculus]XP_051710751.1 putative transmembrane protein 217B [Oryctolagus c
MQARMWSSIAGLFSVLNTIQFLIFNLNQLTHIGYEEKYSIYLETNSRLASWVMLYRQSICTGFSVMTILVGCFLLYCIHKNVYTGLPIYTMWILTYEFTSFSMVLLTHGLIKEQFRGLGYLYLVLQVSRMTLHFGLLPFIVKHAYSLYKDPGSMGKVGRRRRSSISTVDSWPTAGRGMLYRKLN